MGRSFYLVQSLGEGSFDDSSNLSIFTKKRGCYIRQNADTSTPWYNIAAHSGIGPNLDEEIIFLVRKNIINAPRTYGILKAHIRTGADGKFNTGSLEWLVVNSEVSLSDFKLGYWYSTDYKITQVLIYIHCPLSYDSWDFTVLAEGNYNTPGSSKWNLKTYESSGQGGTVPRAGFTYMNSTLATIANTSANAINANNLSTANTITSTKTSTTYLAGNQGQAIINSTAAGTGYTMLSKLNSTNGVFTDGVYQTKRLFQYTTNGTVSAGTNGVTKQLTILDESGNSSFPGTVTAVAFNGPAASTTAAGLMSTAMVTKLNGIATGATKVTITNSLTATTAGTALDATQGKALNDKIGKINVYVGVDGKIHFVNGAGADSALPFKPFIKYVEWRHAGYNSNNKYLSRIWIRITIVPNGCTKIVMEDLNVTSNFIIDSTSCSNCTVSGSTITVTDASSDISFSYGYDQASGTASINDWRRLSIRSYS